MANKIMIHHAWNNKSTPTETTQLIVSKDDHRSRYLNYATIVFLMLNRSLNLVFYKALPTFSWFFAQYLNINYTVFAVTVLNIGSILNIPIAPYYSLFKARYVIVSFELILVISFAIIIGWHSAICLFISRLLSTFAITATRSKVNALIGSYTRGARRARSIAIIEISFGLSSLGYVVVGFVLHQYGYRVFFIATCLLVATITLLTIFVIPSWHTDRNKIKQRQTSRKWVKVKHVKRALGYKRLQLIFISVLLNKIARNAFYYTFSKWLALQYGFGPLQTGYMTLCIAGGYVVGTFIVPKIINEMQINIHLSCLLSAILQSCAMLPEPICHAFDRQISITSISFVIFFYFCGCQIWYNNILDIMIGVTPSLKLLPAVNTIILISGLFGGIIGTIGSTVWFEWGQHDAIAVVCAIINIGVAAIVILLWFSEKIARNQISSRISIHRCEKNQLNPEQIEKFASGSSYDLKMAPKVQTAARNNSESVTENAKLSCISETTNE